MFALIGKVGVGSGVFGLGGLFFCCKTGVGFMFSDLERADLDLEGTVCWTTTCGTLATDLPRADLDLGGLGTGTV